MNQINVIRPYLWEGIWVFDDPAKGLDKEALVAGVPEMIAAAALDAGIENPERGITVLFSGGPFPGASICLEWAREELEGNVYAWRERELEGWLCPALLRYFPEAPKRIYIQLRP